MLYRIHHIRAFHATPKNVHIMLTISLPRLPCIPTPDLRLSRRSDVDQTTTPPPCSKTKRAAHLSQKSGETHDLKGVDSEAAREIAAFAGTVASCSDFDVASTAFSPLWAQDKRAVTTTGT